MIDLRSKSCICCVLETSLTRNFAADLSSLTITRFLGKVWLEILVANLAPNFQDFVANVKKLVALAPVLGTILRPDLILGLLSNGSQLTNTNFVFGLSRSTVDC